MKPRELVIRLEDLEFGMDDHKTYPCAVCGGRVKLAEDLSHKCPPRTLSGKDGADTRAWNEELSPPSITLDPLWRTYHTRLKEAWWLVHGEDE